MGGNKNIIYVVISIIALIFIFNSSQGILFTIQLSRDTVFLDNNDLNTVNLEILQEKDPLVESYIRVDSIQGSSVTSQGSSPYSYYYADPEIGWVGQGTCSGLIGTGSFTSCCKRLGYEDYRSDTGWNVCYGTSTIDPDSLTISLGGMSIYSWDGSKEFPQYTNDISPIVNDICDLNVPLEQRSYAQRDCNNLGSDFTYNDTWQLCIKMIGYGSECEQGELVGVTSSEYICGGSPEYGLGSPGDCIIPVIIESNNGYGTIILSLDTQQTSAPLGVDISILSCPEGFNKVNSVCYQESDLYEQIKLVDDLANELNDINNELVFASNYLESINLKITNGENINQEDIDKISSALDIARLAEKILEDNKVELEFLKSELQNREDASNLISTIDILINDYSSKQLEVSDIILSLEETKFNAEELSSEQIDSSLEGESESTQTIELDSQESKTSISLSDSISKIDEYIGTSENGSSNTLSLFGYEISYTSAILMFLVFLFIGYFIFKGIR